MQEVLQANDRIAEENKQLFKKNRNLVLNLMSSPGAGKTSLLEKTAEKLAGKLKQVSESIQSKTKTFLSSQTSIPQTHIQVQPITIRSLLWWTNCGQWERNQ